MPALVQILIALLFLSGALEIAHAAGSYEIKSKKGLFVFEDFRQWVNLRYTFSDHYSRHGSTKSTSVSHALQESYNFGLRTAVFNPHVFDTNLQAGILYNQNRNKADAVSSSGSDATYQYHFSGSGFDRSPTPFTLLSFRDINTVESAYSLPYTTDSSGTEFDGIIRNDLLQSRFHIARNTAETRGGGFNSNSAANSFSYSGAHTYKGFSSTSLNLFFTDQTSHGSTGVEQVTTSNTMLFTNTLTMGPQKKYSLLTTFQINNINTDDLPQRDMNLGESFHAQLGRALSLDAIYTLANSRSTDLTGQIQENTQNSGEANLKHQLFKSLKTTLHGRAAFNRMNDGIENNYNVRGDLRYSKILTATSRLNVGFSKGYKLVDRQLGSSTVTVQEELHSGVHQGDIIVLPLADGTLQSVVSVKSRDPVFTYAEGTDYTVDNSLGRISIQAGIGARIDITGSGMDLYISYTVSKVPLAKFATDSLAVNSDLSLLDNKLQLGASYGEEKQTLIRGPESNSLRDSRSVMLYAGGTKDNLNYRITYQDFVSGSQAYQSIEGSGKAVLDTSSYALSLMARDRYYKHDAGITTVGYSENSAELSVSYLRGIRSNMNISVQANVLDIRSDLNGPRDSISLRAKFLMMFKKLVVTLSGQTIWALENGGITRDDSLHLDINRDI